MAHTMSMGREPLYFLWIWLMLGVSAFARAGDPDPAPVPKAGLDSFGEPLPDRALARFGTTRLRHGEAIEVVAFSPDGKALATGCDDGTLGLWDLETGMARLYFQADRPEVRPEYVDPCPSVNGVFFLSDGRTLVTAGADKTIHFWDTATGKETRKFAGHGWDSTALALSTDGTMIASAGGNGNVWIWNVKDGQVVLKLDGRIANLAFSPDGKFIASCGGDPIATVWDLRTAQVLLKLKGSDEPVKAIAFSRDGQWFASGALDGKIRLWEFPSGKLARTMGIQDALEGKATCSEILCLAFAPDGRTLASGASEVDPAVRVWEVATGKQTTAFERLGGAIHAVAYSPDGTLLAAGGANNAVRLFDLAKSLERVPVNGHLATVEAVAITGDGKTCLTGSLDGTLRIWEAASGKELALLRTGRVNALTLSPDSKMLATCSAYDHQIRLWDLATRAEVRQIAGPAVIVPFTSVTYMPDGASLAALYSNNLVGVWNAATGKEKWKVRTRGTVTRLVRSPDAKVLVTGGFYCPLIIWDAAEGKCLHSIDLQKTHGQITALDISPQGQSFATVFNHRAIKILDAKTGKEIATFPVEIEECVQAVAFSPDGTVLAAGQEHVVVLWDVAAGKKLRQLTGHRGAVTSLAFSADGTKLLSGSADTTALLWDVSNLKP